MDSASLNFFTPILDGVDQWVELAPLLPLLVILELFLSADNAVALASITKGLPTVELQRKSLNIGIFISLFLRIILIIGANIIIKYSIIQIIAAVYLLSIVINKFFFSENSSIKNQEEVDRNSNSFLKVTILLCLTDLAFSIDSVTAAVAISDQILLVITGAIIGILALRFTADLFIRWLDIFTNLENAGYLAVGLVAFKLIIEVVFYSLQIPEYSFYLFLIATFAWGFSTKKYKSE